MFKWGSIWEKLFELGQSGKKKQFDESVLKCKFRREGEKME